MHTEVCICKQVHIIRMDDVRIREYIQYMYIIHGMYSATGLIADLKSEKPL